MEAADRGHGLTQPAPVEIVTPPEVLPALSPGQVPPAKRLIQKQNSSRAVTSTSIDLQVADLWMQARSGTTTPFAQHAQLSASNKQISDLMDIPRLRFGELSTSRGLDDHITFSYFDFLNLKSLSKVQPDDVRYLEFTGSLHIPMRPVLDEFVREYFLHVWSPESCGFSVLYVDLHPLRHASNRFSAILKYELAWSFRSQSRF